MRNKRRKEKKANPYKLHNFLFCITNVVIPLSILIAIIPQCKNFKIDKDIMGVLVQTIIATIIFVVTVISISISLQREKIFGVENKAIRNLKITNHFSFVWIMLISLIAISLICVFYLLQLLWLSLACMLVAIIYLTWFLIQELPLLINGEKTAKKIVKRKFLTDLNSNNFKNEKVQTFIEKMLLKRGIKETYETFFVEPHSQLVFDLLVDTSLKMVMTESEKLKTLNAHKTVGATLKNINAIINEDIDISKFTEDMDYAHIIAKILFIFN